MQYITDLWAGQPLLIVAAAMILVAIMIALFGGTALFRTRRNLSECRSLRKGDTERTEQLAESIAKKVAEYLERKASGEPSEDRGVGTDIEVEEIPFEEFSISPVRNRNMIISGSKEKGSVLMVSMIILLLLTMLAVSAMQIATTEIKITKNFEDSFQAFQWAENGIAEAGWELATDWETVKADYIAAGDSYTGTRTEGYTTYDYDFLQYHDEVSLGSGLEGFLVQSIGTTTTGAIRTVNQVFIHQDVPVNINSALALHPAGSVTLKGNSTISGKDHDVPFDFDCNGAGCAGSLSGNPDVTGIYSETNVGDLTTIGSPTLEGAPATQTGGGAYDEAYWTAYANNVASMATVKNGADISSGSVSWGTRDNPVIHVIDQNMLINANLDGAGILIIKSDVTVNGNFHFEGLILVASPGAVNFTVGGTARIFGATIAASPSATIDVGATGTPGILFSSAALGNLNNINGVRRTAWSEQM